MKITFLGGGEMATELIGSLFGGGFPVSDVKVIETNDERRRQVGEGFGVRTFAAPVSEALDCDILLLAVEPGQIARTLSLKVGETDWLVVARGDTRLDNRKAKAAFGGKARMLSADEVVEHTGHPVGRVCPFGLATPLPIYCDVSLTAFDEVLPAAGSTHAAIRIAPARLAAITGAEWVDVCKTAE